MRLKSGPQTVMGKVAAVRWTAASSPRNACERSLLLAQSPPAEHRRASFW